MCVRVSKIVTYLLKLAFLTTGPQAEFFQWGGGNIRRILIKGSEVCKAQILSHRQHYYNYYQCYHHYKHHLNYQYQYHNQCHQHYQFKSMAPCYFLWHFVCTNLKKKSLSSEFLVVILLINKIYENQNIFQKILTQKLLLRFLKT